jgi:hypothetical protein
MCPVPAAAAECAALQRVPVAGEGRAARRAPDVRPKDVPVMAPRSTVTARQNHRKVYEREGTVSGLEDEVQIAFQSAR